MNGDSGPGLRRRVAVNMTWCRMGRVGGSEEYLCRQLIGLEDPSFDVTVYAPSGFGAAHPDVAERHRIVEMRHDAESRLRRMASESGWLYRKTNSAHLVHHGGGTVPVVHRSPILLTIHDLQYLDLPENFGPRRLAYLRWAMPRAARSADLIATPTQFVRSSVIDAFGIDPEDVVVVPHGVESTLGENATSEDKLRRRFALGDGPIVLFPAVTHPHKGHDFLLEVHRRFWAGTGVTLVLIGGKGDADSKVREVLADPARSRAVRHLGRVSDGDRDGLIAMASAVVFPSRYEGFGAPVIEAMALGTPVISSDLTCLPEVVADAGLKLPLEVEAWRTALEAVDSRRSEFAELGRRRSREFTAAKSGAALGSAYHRLLER